MSTELLIALSVVEAVLLVVVLGLALFLIERRLRRISGVLSELGGALQGVEGHLGRLGPAVLKINSPLQAIVGALPGIAEKAGIVARR
ncbi:MAG: hypothetical protein ACR2ML_01390 [Solirubrobacteraceae bacterium]